MKPGHLILALLTLLPLPAAAQDGPPPMVRVAAPAEPAAIPLYGKDNPGSPGSEIWVKFWDRDLAVRNVTYPTLTPVLPQAGKANGAAVIVAPGGAFMLLSWDLEGRAVARALADRGITAFVLKYRTVPTPLDDTEAGKFMGEMLMKEVGAPMAGSLLKESKGPADARAAIALVRRDAARWGIDPRRVGMIGFSAGAMTARRVALDAPAAERPDFLGYIYGPQDGETVSAEAPPMFNAIALDDSLFPSKGFPIVADWLNAKRPVELHAYQTGDHGFGLGREGTTTTGLVDQFVAWLSMQGFLTQPEKK